LPLHRIRLCIYDCVCVCVFASLCVCQLLILYKHTHACALAHTFTHIDDHGKRGTPRRWVEERQRERERERKKITLYIGAQDDCYAVCSIYDCWGVKIHSRISFRSDDDNDGVPSRSISTQLRRYDFFFLLDLSFTASIAVFSLIDTTSTITLIGFLAII
jgi:hypothetical protein